MFKTFPLFFTVYRQMLRAVLSKKKYPRRQKFLDTPGTGNDKEQGEASNGNNWVKTDSECKYTTYSCQKNCAAYFYHLVAAHNVWNKNLTI